MIDEDTIKIGDFIEARIFEAASNDCSNPYMSPEMIRFHQSNNRNENEISNKTDVWYVKKEIVSFRLNVYQ